MRRSRFVTLLSMGTAAVALTACDDPTSTAVFETQEQCIESKLYDASECVGQFAQAKKTHVAAAPAFASVRECEAEFGPGKCEPAPEAQQGATSGSGHSLFMPLMMGYMMGSLSRGGTAVPPQPLYRGWEGARPGAFRTADSTLIANGTGRTTVDARSVRTPTARTATVARGGFGARAVAGS